MLSIHFYAILPFLVARKAIFSTSPVVSAPRSGVPSSPVFGTMPAPSNLSTNCLSIGPS
jgi:hypothetical protein